MAALPCRRTLLAGTLFACLASAQAEADGENLLKIRLERHQRKRPSRAWARPVEFTAPGGWGLPWQPNSPWMPWPLPSSSQKPSKSKEALPNGLQKVDIKDIQDVQYIGFMWIGTPTPRSFRMILDTGSSDLWVSNTVFDPHGSSTWVSDDAPSDTKLQYGKGLVTGTTGTDQVCLLADPHNLCIRQELLVASATKDISLMTFDGILGLGLPGISHAHKDFLQNLAKSEFAGGTPCFSFELKREAQSHAVFGPCHAVMRAAAHQTDVPEARAAHLPVQCAFGLTQPGWWMVEIGVRLEGVLSVDGTWNLREVGETMLVVAKHNWLSTLAALMLVYWASERYIRHWNRLWKPRSAEPPEMPLCSEVATHGWPRCCRCIFLIVGLFLYSFLTVLGVAYILNLLIDEVLARTFHMQVNAMLDTGTSFIVIPRDDFRLVTSAMFGEGIYQCWILDDAVSCPCTLAKQSKPMHLDVGNLQFRIDPRETFIENFEDPSQQVCKTGLGMGPEDSAWILGDVFLRQAVVVHDPRGNVSIFPRKEVEFDEPAASQVKVAPLKPDFIYLFERAAFITLLFAPILRSSYQSLRRDCLELCDSTESTGSEPLLRS